MAAAPAAANPANDKNPRRLRSIPSLHLSDNASEGHLEGCLFSPDLAQLARGLDSLMVAFGGVKTRRRFST
jgi:hypothetical protein